MSTLDIRKIDITKIDTDCVVNAANPHLAEGGGVCGAIFAAAGAHELQQACDVIGYCKTGSAVITPGFRLKAKYIIHAVGPRWSDGKHDEEKLLESCYRAAMQLAKENGCHTIAFPLISSGIYGYPVPEAWHVALTAVLDFQQQNADYPLDVVFTVTKDAMVQQGSSILNRLQRHEEIPDTVVRFHRTEEKNGYLSNWYLSEFILDGKTYCCAEQYMMERKALLFGDKAAAEKIMQTQDQQTMQDLGRSVKPYVSQIWDGMKQLIVYRAVYAKFEQNPGLRKLLLSTGTAMLVECSHSDKVWGVGLGMHDSDADDYTKWNGQNLLGFTLMAVREELRKR